MGAADDLLKRETSPDLLQRAGDPVHWRPWCKAALDEAKAANKPILVSIGYAACHWCHVMAHEAFEDPEIAALMNTRFVCVKVDREEHPAVDALGLAACQAMTGHGGWPQNAFLTPPHAPSTAGPHLTPASRRRTP